MNERKPRVALLILWPLAAGLAWVTAFAKDSQYSGLLALTTGLIVGALGTLLTLEATKGAGDE